MPVNDSEVMTDLISVCSAAAWLSDLFNKIYREGAGPGGTNPKTPANGLNFSSAYFNSAIAALNRAPALAATVSTAVNDNLRILLAEPSTQPVEHPPQLTCAQLRQIRNAIERELLTAGPKEKASLEATLAAVKAQAKGCPE